MHDHPRGVRGKRDASMRVAFEMVRRKLPRSSPLGTPGDPPAGSSFYAGRSGLIDRHRAGAADN